MAEPTPIKCPSCGSSNVAPIPLSLIAGQYYKCGSCVVTFRASPPVEEPPDVGRFNNGWSIPPDKPKP
jgi:hypothetical protein